MPPHAEAQEVEALVDVGDPRLAVRQAQAHRGEHRCGLVTHGLGVGTSAGHQHHEVVRIADEPVRGQTRAPPLLARARVRAHRRPGRDEVLVEDREGDVGQQRD